MNVLLAGLPYLVVTTINLVLFTRETVVRENVYRYGHTVLISSILPIIRHMLKSNGVSSVFPGRWKHYVPPEPP